VPNTTVAPCFSVNVVELTVSGFKDLLKVALNALEIPTLVAPFAGTVEVTVGGVVSGAAPVVKLQTYGNAREFPARSMIPVESVAVKTEFAANALEGVNVAVTPEYPTAPVTAVVPCLRVNVPEFTVKAFNTSLNVALKPLEIAILIAPLAGTVEITAGGVPVVKLQT
jgi:hypothetical protein